MKLEEKSNLAPINIPESNTNSPSLNLSLPSENHKNKGQTWISRLTEKSLSGKAADKLKLFTRARQSITVQR